MSDAEASSLLGFEVCGVRYAIDIERVREIIRPLPTQALPHAPSGVIGVVDHRGDVVPVIDLRLRFAASAADGTSQARWIIVTRAGHLVGLVVDRVDEVFRAADAQPRQVPELGQGSDARAITAACSHRDRLVFVLDVDRVTEVVPGHAALPSQGMGQP